ncbi:hypothetical protein D3C84_652430 [compost metagenome]
MFLDQGDLGLHRRADVGTDQATGAGADHHQIAVEAPGLDPAGVDLARLEPAQRLARPSEPIAEHLI